MDVRGDFVNVGIRVRPSHDTNNNLEGIKVVKEQIVLFLVNKKQWLFTFDNIFTQDSTQEEVFQKLVQPLVKEVLSGYNSTVIAYGQTGTGKTYTIGTDLDRYNEGGFILKTLDEFFNNQEEQIEIRISISYCEIYNEEVYDLLSTKNSELFPGAGFKGQRLIEKTIKNAYEAYLLLKLGCQNQHITSIKRNKSSRPHTIFTIHCKVQQENNEISAKFNLVDLASSENVIMTENGDSQLLKEGGVNTNCSLLALGEVIHALSANSQCIPYEKSIITSMLKDSLGNKNFITLVACISPDIQDINETIQTLDFAQNALKIKNRPEVNALIQHQKMQNDVLYKRPVLGSSLKRDCLSTGDFSTICSFKKLKVLNNTSSTKHKKNGIIDKNEPEDSPVVTCIAPISTNLTVPPTGCPFVQRGATQCVGHEASIYTTLPVPFSASPMVQRRATECVDQHKMSIVMNNFQQLRNLTISPQVFMEKITEMIERRIVDRFSSHTVHKIAVTSTPINSDHDNMCISDLSPIAPVPLKFDRHRNIESTLKVPIVSIPQLQSSTKNSKTVIDSSEADLSVTTVDLTHFGPSTSKTNTRSERSLKLTLKGKDPPRRSLRLAAKQMQTTLASGDATLNLSGNIQPTPTVEGNDRNTSKISNSRESSQTNRNKSVLQLLNTGTVKDLQTLSSIGIKTATQIHKFRQINGQFNKLKDLERMPAWRGNAFQRFLKQNFLKLD